MKYKEFLGKKVVFKFKDGTTMVGILDNLLGKFIGQKKKRFKVERLVVKEKAFFSWSIEIEDVEEIKLYDD